MENKNGRHGACDRCRGQKLRCVGAADPILIAGSHFQRNATPCDRCKRAKVECYSLRPASSRNAAAAQDRAQDKQPNHSQPYAQPYGVGSIQSYGPPIQPRKEVSIRDTSSFPNLPEDSIEWIYPRDGNQSVEDHDHVLELDSPSWMLESEMNIYPDSMMGSISHDSGIEIPTGTTASTERDANDIDFRPTITQRSSSALQNQIGLDPHEHHNSSHTQRPPQQAYRRGPESTRSCLQELAKFNEMLLREKNNLEDTNSDFGQRSIGQTLQHCHHFLTILRRMKASLVTSGSSDNCREWPWSTEEERLDDSSHSCAFTGHNGNNSSSQDPSLSSPSISYTCSSASSATTPPTVTHLEVSTLLSILSCYTYILQSYENLFTPILDAITCATPRIPPTLSGLHLDGFELNNYHTLQLECLVNVSYSLLEKTEIILTGPPGGQGGLLNQQKRGDNLISSLLDALQEPNTLAHCGNGKREVRAKRLILDIQAALKAMDV